MANERLMLETTANSIILLLFIFTHRTGSSSVVFSIYKICFPSCRFILSKTTWRFFVDTCYFYQLLWNQKSDLDYKVHFFPRLFSLSHSELHRNSKRVQLSILKNHQLPIPSTGTRQHYVDMKLSLTLNQQPSLIVIRLGVA